MGNYGSYMVQKPRVDENRKIHPIWRGVGFVMMVIIPLISYAAAVVLIEQNTKNNWIPFPFDLLAAPGDWYFYGDPLFLIKLMLTVAFILVFFSIFTFVTFIINSAFGRTRYGPYDLPPVTRRRRRRK
jgi:hypothetical protein